MTQLLGTRSEANLVHCLSIEVNASSVHAVKGVRWPSGKEKLAGCMEWSQHVGHAGDSWSKSGSCASRHSHGTIVGSLCVGAFVYGSSRGNSNSTRSWSQSPGKAIIV